MRIAFTGGGTGGHFFPILAVAREIKRMAEEERILDLQLFYFGPQPFDPGLMQKEDILFVPIAAGKIRRYFSLWNITDIFKTALGILQAMANMFVVMPDVVFAKGGYGSFPTLLAARIYRVPVIIHESDARPGRVNRWAGKWAIRIAIAFEGAAEYFPQERTALTGTPIRKRILGGSQEEARESLGVFSDRPVIFIIGGSQGARVINETITQILPQLLEHYEIIHQVGDKNIEDLKLETASILEDTHIARREPGGPDDKGGGLAPYYHLLAFLNESQMRSAYFLSDLIISRAGATALAEIAAWGKPAIIIPIKNAAQDHQRENAYDYSRGGTAVIIEEDNLTPSVLWNEIQKLMADPERRARMAVSAKEFFRPDAAEIIAQEILKLGLH